MGSAPRDEYLYSRDGHAAYRTTDYVFHQLIPYIGNKRKLLDLIHQAIDKTDIGTDATFLDLFAGSGVVSRMAKKKGFHVITNDWEPYAQEINRCYIQCNAAPDYKHFGGYEKAIAQLNAVTPREDWITRHLCPANDQQYDIHKERMFYQACYTSNTSGVFKGFHNGWGGQTKTALYRILSRFQLKPRFSMIIIEKTASTKWTA